MTDSILGGLSIWTLRENKRLVRQNSLCEIKVTEGKDKDDPDQKTGGSTTLSCKLKNNFLWERTTFVLDLLESTDDSLILV